MNGYRASKTFAVGTLKTKFNGLAISNNRTGKSGLGLCRKRENEFHTRNGKFSFITPGFECT